MSFFEEASVNYNGQVFLGCNRMLKGFQVFKFLLEVSSNHKNKFNREDSFQRQVVDLKEK